jgi:hypothetical protein
MGIDSTVLEMVLEDHDIVLATYSEVMKVSTIPLNACISLQASQRMHIFTAHSLAIRPIEC